MVGALLGAPTVILARVKGGDSPISGPPVERLVDR